MLTLPMPVMGERRSWQSSKVLHDEFYLGIVRRIHLVSIDRSELEAFDMTLVVVVVEVEVVLDTAV